MSRQPYLESPKIPCKNGRFDFGKSVPDQERWFLCGNAIRQVFEGIPQGAKFIQFRAYREDGPDRYKIKFSHKDCFVTIKGDMITTILGGIDNENSQEVRWLDEDTYAGIMAILGRRRKTWYIEVYYWI